MIHDSFRSVLVLLISTIKNAGKSIDSPIISNPYEASGTTIIQIYNTNTNTQQQGVNNPASNTINNFQGANIGNFANELKDNAQQTASDFTQTSGTGTAELLQLITTLREQAQSFPEAQREDIFIELEDLEEQAQKTAEQHNRSRINKRLMTLLTTAAVIGGSITTATDFVNNVTDLGQKFGIELQLPPGL